MRKLLIEESPLQVLPTLAVAIGLNEAIMLQQVHYWLRHNDETGKSRHAGRVWMYSSVDRWAQKDFTFWCESTIKRTLNRLKQMNLLITGNYNKSGYDRTTWYTINYEELDRLLAGTKAQERVPKSMGPEWPNASGQDDLVDQVKVSRPIPETTTETTGTEIEGEGTKGDPAPAPFEFNEQEILRTLKILNHPAVLRWLLECPAVNRKLHIDLVEVLKRGPGKWDDPQWLPRFPLDADTRKAMWLIADALKMRDLPATPIHVASVVIQAYSHHTEEGLGHRMIAYIHRTHGGLTLRPFVVFKENRGSSLVEQTISSLDVVIEAEWIETKLIKQYDDLVSQLTARKEARRKTKRPGSSSTFAEQVDRLNEPRLQGRGWSRRDCREVDYSKDEIPDE
jgi:hypothetical protein